MEGRWGLACIYWEVDLGGVACGDRGVSVFF